MRNRDRNENRKRRVILFILIILIAAAGIGAGACLVMNSMNANNQSELLDTPAGSSTGKVKNGQSLSFEEDQSQVKRSTSQPNIVMPGWNQIQIDANTPDVYVDFYNPAANTGNYHMTFELVLADTGETLYKSGLIKAGDHVKKITLSHGLSPGTYKGCIKIQPYTADDQMKATNNAEFELLIIAS